MAHARDGAYHADSDADDEFERSVITSPHHDGTDSDSDSDIASNEHTPTTFGPNEHLDLPKTIITEWTPEECAQFVANLNLQQYCDAFIEHGIVGEALVALKQEELKEMGITSVGHRLTILKNVYDVKISQDVPIDPDDYIPQSADQSHQHENATKEELARVARSIIRLRDERIAQVESQLLRLAEDYRKLRTELLPLFKMTKERSEPLPYAPAYQPTTAADLYSESIGSPPPTAQMIPEKSSLSRSLSKKFGLSSNNQKSNASPTYIPSTIHEGRALIDPSNLNPSAAASAASNQLNGAMHSSATGGIPSPTSPMPYQHQPLAPRAYQRENSTGMSRYDGIDDNMSRSNPIPTPPIVHDPPKSASTNKFSVVSTLSQADTLLPSRQVSQASTLFPSREMSASVPPQFGRSSDRHSHQMGERDRDRDRDRERERENRDRHTPGPQGEGEAPSVEIFKSFRVALEDPCYKVLPAALRKYNIHADWRQYALYIVYGDQERCVGLEEKPLALFKDLDREGKKPVFMLRKLANPVDLSTISGGLQPTPGPATAGIGMSRPLGLGGGNTTPGPGVQGSSIPSIRSMQPGSATLPGGVL